MEQVATMQSLQDDIATHNEKISDIEYQNEAKDKDSLMQKYSQMELPLSMDKYRQEIEDSLKAQKTEKEWCLEIDLAILDCIKQQNVQYKSAKLYGVQFSDNV